METPTFTHLWKETLKIDIDDGGIWALVPWLFIIIICAGIYLGLSVPFDLDGKAPDNLFKIIASLITAQGILLALCMNTFSSILHNISEKKFALFLKSNKLLHYYMFLVQYIQGWQILSLTCLILSSLLLMFNVPSIFMRISLGVSLGFFIYAARWASGTFVMLRDLIWYRGVFEELQDSGDVILGTSRFKNANR